MNKIQKTYMEAELKEQEIKIYRLVKNDIQYILETMENAGGYEIKTILNKYIFMVDKKIISLEEGGK